LITRARSWGNVSRHARIAVHHACALLMSYFGSGSKRIGSGDLEIPSTPKHTNMLVFHRWYMHLIIVFSTFEHFAHFLAHTQVAFHPNTTFGCICHLTYQMTRFALFHQHLNQDTSITTHTSVKMVVSHVLYHIFVAVCLHPPTALLRKHEFHRI
jgi:hypothetical protein